MANIKSMTVGGGTLAGKLASAAAHNLERGKTVEFKFIGPAAAYQALKASVVLRGMLSQRGLSMYMTPSRGIEKTSAGVKTVHALRITAK